MAKVSSLKLNKKNPRKFKREKLDQLKKSLQEFPDMLYARPIVINDQREILGGNGRLIALRELDIKEVPILNAKDFTPEQQKEFTIKDNVGFGDWDWEALAGEEWGIEKVASWGLDDIPDEWKLEAPPKGPPPKEETFDVEQAVTRIKNPTAKRGDIWILGRHRIMCGDCRDLKNIETLMSGELADAVITDPPYNVDYDPEKRESYFSPDRKANPLGVIKNDKMSPEVFHQFLCDAYAGMNHGLKLGAAIYIFHADSEGHHFRNAFFTHPWKMASTLIWCKTVLCFGRADYHWMHEPILYGWKEGAPHNWYSDRKQTSLLTFPTDHYNKSGRDTDKYVHPTQKPTNILRYLMDNSLPHGDGLVIDTFLGSGSTLIAAEQTQRRCFGTELDPIYVDVIIQRWQNYTGLKAVHAETGKEWAELKPAK